MSASHEVSVIIPAFNESSALAGTIEAVRRTFHSAGVTHEIVVVDDGSTDTTAEVARSCGATVVTHPENLGYGAALKSGITHARYGWIAITDADGTYPAEEFVALLKHVPAFDMVVGARTGSRYAGGIFKRVGRWFFKWLAEYVTGRHIPDINSGMRIFRRDFVLAQFRHISSGFSFTTTLTLSMMLESMCVKYVPVPYRSRVGNSHVRYWRDSLRAAQIIFQAIAWYNPIKLYLLLGATALVLSVIGAALAAWSPAGSFSIFLVWAGCMGVLLAFAMGMLAYVLRTMASTGKAPADHS